MTSVTRLPLALVLTSLLPVGCSSSPAGGACEDPRTTEQVLTLAKADLVKKVGQDVAMKTELSLQGISTVAEQGSRVECRAELNSQYPAEVNLPPGKLPITFVSEVLAETGHSVKLIGL